MGIDILGIDILGGDVVGIDIPAPTHGTNTNLRNHYIINCSCYNSQWIIVNI